MDRERVIACAGLGEAELAHLRLLLRACADELSVPWRLGEEDGADLLVVDVRDFAGEMAQARARCSGLRCAIFSDVPVPDAELVLQRPLQRATLIELLNRVGSGGGKPLGLQVESNEFRVHDLGIGMAEARPASARAGVAPTLDDLLALQREQDRQALGALRVKTAATPRVWASREAMLEETAPRPLREYLSGGLLRGPARFELEGALPIVLDPKHRLAHIAGGLHAAEAYVRARWRLCDWVPLRSSELAQARDTLVAVPYVRLAWLDVLLHSAGHLARHLDPKATYRLTEPAVAEAGYAWVHRIASTLLQPLRLHEIAAASGAKMADVFDVVNAYDAIGLIESRLSTPVDSERSGRSWFGRRR